MATVGSLEQEGFQGTLEDWSGTHQLEFCWQPVPCSGGGGPATEDALSPNFRRVMGTTQSPFDASRRVGTAVEHQ